MSGGLKTSYEFTLPRGYIDHEGRLQRVGTMRLATARDELEPLRDPTVSGPDDPRLTILVLTRVIERLGDLELVTSHEIEGLCAVDLAYLQDFYGVINFGDQSEFDELVRSQRETVLLGSERDTAASEPVPPSSDAPGASEESEGRQDTKPQLRKAVEELPRRAL
jgi:hypothetical protein